MKFLEIVNSSKPQFLWLLGGAWQPTEIFFFLNEGIVRTQNGLVFLWHSYNYALFQILSRVFPLSSKLKTTLIGGFAASFSYFPRG